MANKPPVVGSPLGDHNAIEDLQHSSQSIHTSSPLHPDAAVATLTFTASDTAPATTNKHHLTPNNSRTKKKTDTKKTPVPLVSFAPNVNINEGNESDDVGPPNIRRGNNDSLQFQYDSTPSNNTISTSAITPSPNDDTDMSNNDANNCNTVNNENGTNNNNIDNNNASGTTSAAQTQTNSTNNTEENNNKKSKKKKKVTNTAKIILNNEFLQYIRSDTFDSDRFKKGEPIVYTDDAMLEYDNKYSEQLGYDFSQRRASKKKNDTARASRSTADIDLDTNEDAYNVETSDFRQLSRYILEDMLKCKEGDKFLLLLPKDAKEGSSTNIPKSVPKQQQTDNIGGDVVKISKREYYCLKCRVTTASMNDHIRLGMSRAEFIKQFNNSGGGFIVEFDGTDHKLRIAWNDMIHNPREINVLWAYI